MMPGEPRLTIEPRHLSITEHTETNGHLGRPHVVHLIENGDLQVQHTARDVLRNTMEGQVVIALGVDEEHDQIHYGCEGGADARETLQRATEALRVAVEALDRIRKL